MKRDLIRARDADVGGAPWVFVNVAAPSTRADHPTCRTYRHYKGGLYSVFGIGYRRTDVTQHRPVVIYVCALSGEWFIRDAGTWFDLIERDGSQVPRFCAVATP